MTGLVLANIHAPAVLHAGVQVHHGATVTIRPDDPTGAVAVAEALCRFAQDWLKQAERRMGQ